MANETENPQPAASLNPGDLIDEHEAAATLHASVQTLRNWRWRGEGPTWYKIEKKIVRYKRSELAAYIDSQRAA